MRELTPVELEQAYGHVRDYYVGEKLTEKRILAAYMRSIGLTPNGEAWMMAKEAFESGYSFQESASSGLDYQIGGQTKVFPADSSDRRNDVSQRLSREESPKEVPTIWPAPPIFDAPAGIPSHTGSVGTNMARGKGDNIPSDPFPTNIADMSTLTWFPKVCGPGDLIGDGARKLLGQPKVSPVALLVRETAQNSWDARLGKSVRFHMGLRRLNAKQLELIRSKVLVGDPGGLNLRETLSKDEVWVLEISDRGTKGLGGEIRPDLPVPKGQPVDFVNMVFNIGAPSDRKFGGGTYGFGKAVGYLTSGCGTTLIWSRSNEHGSLESRLIGSAIGNNFEDEARRYTGRHWWGVPSSPDETETRVEPLRGPAADAIGEALFEESFDVDSTGTSILIIDPQLGGSSYEESANELAEAALWNLWPKMVPGFDGTMPMDIEIRLEGRPIPIVAPSDHPYLSAYAMCLEAVRGMHEGKAVDLPLGMIQEVRSHNPKRLLGYLAMTRFTSFGEDKVLFPDINPLGKASHHVCLMRHAELVVTYDEMRPLDSSGYHWAAVFQPVEETDPAFSTSEPPAHDEWIPTSITDKVQKSTVRVALRRIREICSSFAAPPLGLDGGGSTDNTPTVDLANALGGLVAALDAPTSVESNEGETSTPSGAGRGKRRKAAVEIQGHRLVGRDDTGRIGAEIIVVPRHQVSGPLILRAEVSAVDESRKRYELESSLVSVEWDENVALGDDVYTVRAEANTPVVLRVFYPGDLTLDVDFSVGTP